MAAQNSVASDDGTHCAFFYGTLMVPAVFYTVCYGSENVPDAIAGLHSFKPAVLHGYVRRRVAYADYPGITEAEGCQVAGSLVTGLTKANLGKLDYFEGGQYERRRVKVKLLEKVGNTKGEGNVEGEEVTAETYVYLNEKDLEDKEWDLEVFRRDRLQFWTRRGYRDVLEDDQNPEDTAKVATE
ncbi:hypothetical protein MFIFM68171_04464 [Madurella fahalii]|uniref:Putative gamma-glutamylcyclotransferase n=1 Tax=Madurella fahalii TaxID=1157608 RepID=A0ABQ0G953_9PEZI